MTTRPPSRGGAGRKGSGAGATKRPGRGPGPAGKSPFGAKSAFGGKRPFRNAKDPDRERTGPRTSALDAAQRAASMRGEADKRAPWRPGDAPDPQAEQRDQQELPSRIRSPRPQKPEATPEDAPRRARAPRAETAAPVEGPTRREQRAAASATLASGVQTLVVEEDEAEMRIDRFLTTRFPQLPFTRVQSIVRKGELRVDGRRAKPNDRLLPGMSVRVPPLKLDAVGERPRSPQRDATDADFIRSLILYEDAEMMILNKPFGLAVQGGSGTVRHVDGLLESLAGADGQKPRLVHRLDKDTAGCLIVAKTRLAAATLAKSFRSRSARKVYWALTAGVPRVPQGRISTYLAKEEPTDADARMRVAQHGDDGAAHALTYYAMVDNAAQKLSWLSLKPVTGRTHQLRAHAAHIGHPIVGDPKYFSIENWELPGGIQNRLHLLARRIVIPHPRTGKPVDVTAPLPPHMAQSWNLLGFDASRYDPIVEAPEA
ncbi:pseudouridine synthase [Methylobacterium sp. Leaf102]|uniref:RluA family pseudouridine synthase n=1 Tax=Methylobacterium sp. Leaf102 TaxID=1736253 RepID=UPI0006FD5E7E|nr:RluA family pseudouridine synthase [Methylobacterium sp. Leaf102]KQP24508.1 pseudouridine synthase [Methylobacterium sp. Leaf102]